MNDRTFTTPSPVVNLMTRAAFKAAKGMVRDFGEVEHLQVSRKGPGDFVYTADKRTEKILYEVLHAAQPAYNFLMEESGEILHSPRGAPQWIIDPLDGTKNFLHGVPHFAISIALKDAGEIIAGIVYDPIKDEMFWTHKGYGAFLNQRRLRVSTRQQMRDMLLATSLPSLKHKSGGIQVGFDSLKHLLPRVASIRSYGALALDLAYVAAGRYDGFWAYGARPWDIAAGILLVKEAGGFISDHKGSQQDMLNSGNVIAGNEAVYRFLQAELHTFVNPEAGGKPL